MIGGLLHCLTNQNKLVMSSKHPKKYDHSKQTRGWTLNHTSLRLDVVGGFIDSDLEGFGPFVPASWVLSERWWGVPKAGPSVEPRAR